MGCCFSSSTRVNTTSASKEPTGNPETGKNKSRKFTSCQITRLLICTNLNLNESLMEFVVVKIKEYSFSLFQCFFFNYNFIIDIFLPRILIGDFQLLILQHGRFSSNVKFAPPYNTLHQLSVASVQKWFLQLYNGLNIRLFTNIFGVKRGNSFCPI